MNTAIEILLQLNESQQEAVKNTEGPLMIIAGAGSGKTRALTYKIAYLLLKNINPFNILALTFTNKAAKEMKERIMQLVGESKGKCVSMGTFHSVFYRILRIECEKLGYTKNLTVYDTDDSKNLIKNILKELNLDPKIYQPKYILGRISSAKSALLNAEDYANNIDLINIDNNSGRPHISAIFTRYNARLKQSDAMDFDDLLYYMNLLLRDFPEVLFKYQNRFQYILVDEYQDTNYAQYMIIKKLAATHHNICVVGDDAQSIYAFRGANINNILNFKSDFPEAKIVKLEQNYRSTKNIVQAANAIIKNNKKQIQKEIWTANDTGNKIDIIKTSTDTEEAISVTHSIFEKIMNYHLSYNQFVILYRTNTQSRQIEEALIKRNIPYVIYGGISVYKRKEIKDVLAYFRLTINHYDEESLLRIINYPTRGIGASTIDKLRIESHSSGSRIWNIIENPDNYPNLELSATLKAKLKDFANRIKSFSTLISNTNAFELGNTIIKQTGIIEDLKVDSTDKERIENIESLLDAMREFIEKEPDAEFDSDTGELLTEYFPSLDKFLQSIALLTDGEENKDEAQKEKVKLMTIHSAKGLEFDYVYVVGMEENLFPSSLSLESKTELEEERRLFYVAITRARKHLTLTHSQTRYRYGNLQFCEPSRFIDEIPISLINTTQKLTQTIQNKPSSFVNKNSFYSNSNFIKKDIPVINSKDINLKKMGREASNYEIVAGVKIYHQKFGYGLVCQTEGNGEDKRAVIDFETVGAKTILLRFGKLLISE